MKAPTFLIGLALSAAIATGCGEEDGGAAVQAPPNTTATLAERQAQLERDPYDIRCADIRDKVASARMTRIVQYALADDAKIRGLNRLQSSQSIYYAITELCKDKPGSFTPATAAIEGVRSGEFRVDLASP